MSDDMPEMPEPEAQSTESRGKPPSSPDDLLAPLLKSQRAISGLESWASIRSAHHATIANALDSRGDPFARSDTLVLAPGNPSVAPISIPCRDLPVTVGRGDTPDVIAVGAVGVSRRHFDLERMGAVIRIRDAGSKNGTFVNGHKIEEMDLCEGDVITVGETELRVHRS